MARSRTSGKVSASEQAEWRRPRGSPGGGRSEAEKQSLTPGVRRRAWRVTPAVLEAFRARDEGQLRALLALEPWQDGPWVADPCESPRGHGPGYGACRCAVLALRKRILTARGAA